LTSLFTKWFGLIALALLKAAPHEMAGSIAKFKLSAGCARGLIQSFAHGGEDVIEVRLEGAQGRYQCDGNDAQDQAVFDQGLAIFFENQAA
jgi:hypothetical protein